MISSANHKINLANLAASTTYTDLLLPIFYYTTRLKNQAGSLSRRKRDEEVVCYPDLGCFFDEGPFDYLDLLPDPPEEVGTALLLYTRENKDKPDFLSYFNMST